MTSQDTSTLISGQEVALVAATYAAEIIDFPALASANASRAELVTAIEAKQEAQDEGTAHTTTAKEEAREKMALATDILSARAQGYALATGQLGLKQEYTLTYTDVRYGDAVEDVNHVRALAQKVGELPEKTRTDYRLTDAIIQAPLDAATLFEKTEDTQTTAKAAPHLATLALPVLLTRLRAALLLMRTLIYGQRNDADKKFRWADLNAAFAVANKRRKVAPKRRVPANGPRIVRTVPVTIGAGRTERLANTNYGPAYTFTVENRGSTALQLWMAQRDGVKTTFGSCPAGEVTVLTRADIGPETARYLMGAFAGDVGGAATVVVRRVVVE